MEQLAFLDNIRNDWTKEWVGMPEYNNTKQVEPEITATFKFRCEEDYNKFKTLVQEYIYKGERVFDGKQLKDQKSTWYPLEPRPSEHVYIANKKINKYPIYVPTKGRFKSRKTVKALLEMGANFKVVIEPQELDDYSTILDEYQILVLPYSKPDESSQLVRTRNWIKNHSKKLGHRRHWQLDDNIKAFYRLNNNKRHKVTSPVIFSCVENFVDRYKNIGMAGLNYMNYAIPDGRPPYVINSRVYSMSLVNNELDYEWRGIYNDDTDICLRMLKDGWCTINFNAFSGDKDATMVTKGGNTPIYTTGDLRSEFADSLVKQHPDCVQKVWRFDRWHHQVDYSSFKKNILIKKDGIDIPDGTNEFGMKLIQKGENNGKK